MSRWRGRQGADPRYDLAESTVQDLSFGDLLDLLGGPEALRGLRLGYGPVAGTPALRQAVGRTCGVDAEQVLTTPGTMLGLCLLASELCRSGGEAVVATPCFGPMLRALERSGARVHAISLRFEAGYRLDAGRIAAALMPNTRLVAIANPQNPSGVRVPADTIREVLAAMTARAPGAVLLIDETYREATYGELPPPSAASLDPRIVTAASLSKAHGAPGLRVGWLTVPDAGLRARLVVAKLNTVISGSVLDETLAAALLARQEAVLAPRRRLLAQALGIVAGWQAAEARRLDWVRPQAGALCCFRLSADLFGAAAVEWFWAALPRHGLRLAPGDWFGEARSVFRLGFGHLLPGDLGEALAALSRVLDESVAPVRGT